MLLRLLLAISCNAEGRVSVTATYVGIGEPRRKARRELGSRVPQSNRISAWLELQDHDATIPNVQE